MKRLFATLGVLAALMGVFSINPHTALAYDPVTESMINDRMIAIYHRYDVGEPLSDEDAEFVATYASSSILRAEPKAGSFDKTKTFYGVKVRFYGNIWHNGTINYNFGGNVHGIVQSGNTPKNMSAVVYCEAFGASSTFTAVYKDEVRSSVSNARRIDMNKSKSYSGVIGYYTVTALLDVNTSNGGFNITF